MILVSSWSWLCPIHWSWVSSLEWRCSWSSADRRCSNYIWVINNLIDYKGAPYIRDLTVHFRYTPWGSNKFIAKEDKNIQMLHIISIMTVDGLATFHRIRIIIFWLTFHWSFFLGVQFKIWHIGLGDGLALNSHQAITPKKCHIVSLCHIELINWPRVMPYGIMELCSGLLPV